MHNESDKILSEIYFAMRSRIPKRVGGIMLDQHSANVLYHFLINYTASEREFLLSANSISTLCALAWKFHNKELKREKRL